MKKTVEFEFLHEQSVFISSLARLRASSFSARQSLYIILPYHAAPNAAGAFLSERSGQLFR
ncbi:MAG: hypothetical protein II771_09495, partial [Clostridia bacterium]|nr:hypothetical protein [Clostridia bacterium]